MKPTHLSLFSGIGGIDLAAEDVGFRTVAFVEIDPYCQKVLRKHWPDVPIFSDVREVTIDVLGAAGIHEVDLLSGGVPCQPSSVAGKQQGSADERWLWPEFLRLVREVRPTWVLAENPTGLFTVDDRRGFPGILRELAALGYLVGWCCYGAGDIGAPHRRDRVFIVGHAERCGRGGKPRRRSGEEPQNGREDVADAPKQGLPWLGQSGFAASGAQTKAGPESGPQRCGEDVAAANKPGSQGRDERQGRTRESSAGTGSESFPRKGQFESRVGRSASRFFGGLDGRWPARPGEGQHDWEPPRVAIGIPNRVVRLRALGNAVVPAQVYPILAAIANAIAEEATP